MYHNLRCYNSLDNIVNSGKKAVKTYWCKCLIQGPRFPTIHTCKRHFLKQSLRDTLNTHSYHHSCILSSLDSRKYMCLIQNHKKFDLGKSAQGYNQDLLCNIDHQMAGSTSILRDSLWEIYLENDTRNLELTCRIDCRMIPRDQELPQRAIDAGGPTCGGRNHDRIRRIIRIGHWTWKYKCPLTLLIDPKLAKNGWSLIIWTVQPIKIVCST